MKGDVNMSRTKKSDPEKQEVKEEKPKKPTTKKNPVERAEENLRKAEGRSKKAADAEKKARRELEQAKEKELTRHLCNRGRAVNTMLKEPDAFTDEEVTELVKLAFSAPEIQQRIDERVPPVAEEKTDENTEEKQE